MVDKDTLTVYMAGDLFDAKDLMGNLLLAEAVERVSGGRYRILLPQNGECEVTDRTGENIRDADLEQLLQCDVILANFDGHDLDSGTVLEFCFAKMADMPALLLRTDFRNSGDSTLPDCEPWNLMCSYYPRTSVLHINAMQCYHCAMGEAAGDTERLQRIMYDGIAAQTVAALDDAVSQIPWLKRDEVFSQYDRIVRSAGDSLAGRLTEERLRSIAGSKINKGIY